MQSIRILLLLFILCLGCGKQVENTTRTSLRSTNHTPLFQITENDKIGFIDSTGRVVIPPQFRSAGDFSEGLASVRLSGTYGYIDATGTFIIPPQFDYATPFSGGLAVVYRNGMPSYIHPNGEQAFECTFPAVGAFENGRALVRTASKKYGMIDTHGKLFIDTVYSEIRPFSDGRAVVKSASERNEVGVIDTLGRIIIPYGKYSEINDLSDGYFKAEVQDTTMGNTIATVVIDKMGKVISYLKDNNQYYIAGDFHCGLARINMLSPSKDGYNSDYEGFIDIHGRIITGGARYASVEDFSDNRAFVRDTRDNYFIIDTRGKIVTTKKFSSIAGSNYIKQGFKNGVALVLDGLWGLIDTNGNYILKPQYRDLDDIAIDGDYIYFSENYSDSNGIYHNTIGIVKTDGRIILQPQTEGYVREGFRDGVLNCYINNKSTYINTSGKIIWQGKELKDESMIQKPAALNIDFMHRAYFEAYSKPKPDYRGGGWAESSNYPKQIPSGSNFQSSSLSIKVVTESMNYYSTIRQKGCEFYIANTTKDTIRFNAQDSRLYMKIQALNPQGKWMDIEYLPNSDCGNSYHIVRLEPNHYWQFVAPRYEGDFKTKLRVELKYIDPSDKSTQRYRSKKEITIYSNEYPGSVNPAQFWRKERYYPTNIMDPYSE